MSESNEFGIKVKKLSKDEEEDWSLVKKNMTNVMVQNIHVILYTQ